MDQYFFLIKLRRILWIQFNMSNIVIKVDNIGKQYRLGQVGTGTLTHDLNRWWYKIRRKEDPYLQIGETNDRTKKGVSEIVWALKNINFEVQQGEVLGIIGRNGAGKSTLLKVLSRVTTPTVGEIKVRGRVASLLEVGTGFHPELTGRENVFLNGAILGMTKQEIKRKFDEIVDFSGVERYIDTPVKRYSSGMYVRLAFAVAAHLEPEILIVDEVLAVGDAEFQKKCLGKMKDVSGEGRTVLFVSHQLGMINSLCHNAILLQNGEISYKGKAPEVVAFYINSLDQKGSGRSFSFFSEKEGTDASILEARIMNVKGQCKNNFDVFEQIVIEIKYCLKKNMSGVVVGLNIDRNGELYACSFDSDEDQNRLKERKQGVYRVKVKLPQPLKAGIYSISNIGIGIANVGGIDSQSDVFSFSVEENSFDPTYYSFSSNRPGQLFTCLNWDTIKEE